MDYDYVELAKTVGIIAAYGAMGVAMLGVGFAVMDLLIPGDMRKQIWEDENINTTILASSALVGVALIVVVSVRAAAGDLAEGLLDTLVFSALGILLLGIAFKVIDLLTPGDMAGMIARDRFHPTVVIAATANIAIALVVSAAIA